MKLKPPFYTLFEKLKQNYLAKSPLEETMYVR